MSLKKNVITTKRMSWSQELKKNWFFYVLVVPGLIQIFLYWVMPLIGVRLAFSQYTVSGGLFHSKWVGWKNFEVIFAAPQYLLRALKNTLVLSISGLLLGLVTNVFMGILVAEVQNLKYRRIVQTLTIFPNFLSWIVIGGISHGLLADDESGFINQIIMLLGGEAIAWHQNSRYWWAIFLLFSAWKGFGYGSLIYFSTLMGVDTELYEAAQIDGAKRWQRIVNISLPMLMPTVSISLLMGIGGVLGSNLEQWIGMTSENPLLLEHTDTLSSYIYRMGIVGGNYEMSAAVGLIRSVVGAMLFLGTNLLVKKMNPEYALF